MSIKILDIDSRSQKRGVGRYVQALKALVESNASDKKVQINPFVNISGAEFPRKGVKSGYENIAVVHDVIPLKYPDKFKTGVLGKIKQKLSLSQLSKYQHIVTDSEASKKDIASVVKIPSEKIKVVYPFSTISEYANQKSRPKMLPHSIIRMGYVLYVGDVNWHKNIAIMARACVESNTLLVCVGKAFEMLKGRIPGNTELEELRSFQKLSLVNQNKIITLGFVTDGELVWLYENALANMLLSHDEGFGYSYIEAGYFGTLSVLSDIPVFREISASKGTMFVDQNSDKSISNALTQIKNSPELRGSLSEEARYQSSKYSKQKFIENWQKLL